MGFYINETSDGTYLHAFNKGAFLVEIGDAKSITKPEKFSDIPEGQALLVEVKNPMWSALGFAYSEREFKAFTLPDDHRPRSFYLMDRELAEKLSGFKKQREQFEKTKRKNIQNLKKDMRH